MFHSNRKKISVIKRQAITLSAFLETSQLGHSEYYLKAKI
jgi:hypothetical protein